MGRGAWIGTVLALAAIGGCDAATGPTSETGGAGGEASTEVLLHFGEARVVADGAVVLRFEAVPEDSRCPVDVTCVWEGNAAVTLSLRRGTEPASTVTLNTTLEPRSARVTDLRITLLGVQPYPSTSSPVPREEYAVRLAVGPQR